VSDNSKVGIVMEFLPNSTFMETLKLLCDQAEGDPIKVSDALKDAVSIGAVTQCTQHQLAVAADKVGMLEVSFAGLQQLCSCYDCRTDAAAWLLGKVLSSRFTSSVPLLVALLADAQKDRGRSLCVLYIES
jgi:hypothetical protein